MYMYLYVYEYVYVYIHVYVTRLKARGLFQVAIPFSRM